MADTAEQTQYDKDLQDLNAIKKTGVGTSVIAQLEKDFAKKYPNGRPVTPVAASNTEIATALKIATNLGIGEALLNDPTYGAELKKVFEDLRSDSTTDFERDYARHEFSKWLNDEGYRLLKIEITR